MSARYDAGNRLMVLSDSLSGMLSWNYDGFDQVTQANGPQGSIVYGYDAVGRRTSMQAATQTKVNYAYDDGDRLTGIAQGSDTVSFAYDNANRLSSKTLPNQVQTVYVYNDANQVTGLAWGKTGQAALGSLGYGYDSRGQLVAQTGSHAPQALPPASTNNTFDDNNRQTQANGNARSYDADGHLLSDGTRTYTWDDRDHLSQITQGGTVIASYSYDALGRRSAKTESGATTQYLYDGLNTVQEMQGTTINPILTGPGIDERYARDDNGGRTYFLTDLLGSTRLLTDTNGNAVQRYDYDPYGTTTQSSTSYNNPYQYTGREHDQSGLYYYRARYYMPELGRFISEDPIKLAGGVNGYAYVGENPISYFDPIGLQSYTPGKMPPSNIPGGPWTPDPSRPPGNFLGPPNGANRQMCSYVPDAKNGGPASATNGAYWKEKVSGEKGWFRYNLDGVPITPEMAHPGAQSTPDWLDIMRISSAWGVVTFFATYSAPLGESEQQIIDSRNENSGSP
ncbi:RHS repeat-associated core domain-containing protein [Xanthomonas albilineans]|uniref:RHS repeat-associated core domain-containing protein n=1 Tax=Xanthomonas albilineans TaxID=29447 RepID=UPI001E4AC0C7|nr:RHS repeat-associated core domain-containing protein [Xanthomonas albilineans]